MWMQLVRAHTEDDSLFEGDKKAVERRIRSILQLGSKDTFPAGRVVTLWRNERWREMLTQWYDTQLGREVLHNISPCEWMASLQIDGVSLSMRINGIAATDGLTADSTGSQPWRQRYGH